VERLTIAGTEEKGENRSTNEHFLLTRARKTEYRTVLPWGTGGGREIVDFLSKKTKRRTLDGSFESDLVQRNAKPSQQRPAEKIQV